MYELPLFLSGNVHFENGTPNKAGQISSEASSGKPKETKTMKVHFVSFFMFLLLSYNMFVMKYRSTAHSNGCVPQKEHALA